MALHIQMSEEAEAELKKQAMRNRISSLTACLLFLIFGGCILYFTVLYIAGETPANFITYTPPNEDAPPTDTPVSQQFTAKSSPASAEVTPDIIVATGTTSMVMAPVSIDAADGLDLSPSVDVGMGMGMGGLGDGLGSGGGGMGTSQGGGSALEGTFYDFKQTKSGATTDIGRAAGGNITNSCKQIIKDFIDKNWNASVLNKFYQSKTKLYASTFYMPQLAAEYAPYAYQCADKVQAKAIMAVYRGKVKAPKTGKFRFVGGGDEVLAVRFNRKNVLEWGYEIPTLGFSGNHLRKGQEANFKNGVDTLKKNRGYGNVIRYKRGDDPTAPAANGFERFCNEVGLIEGTTFDVKQGESYPIEILISEFGGGAFGFFLFIEDVTDGPTKNKVKSGAPLYQVFRTNFNNPNHENIKKMVEEDNKKAGKGFNRGWNNDNLEGPPFDQDSLIWTAVP